MGCKRYKLMQDTSYRRELVHPSRSPYGRKGLGEHVDESMEDVAPYSDGSIEVWVEENAMELGFQSPAHLHHKFARRKRCKVMSAECSKHSLLRNACIIGTDFTRCCAKQPPAPRKPRVAIAIGSHGCSIA